MKNFRFYYTVIAVLLLISPFISCSKKESKELKTEAGLVENTEAFTGMGGYDRPLPSEQPGQEGSEKTIKAEDLFYSVYTVQQGDMVGKIAETYGVSQDSIISLNKLKNTRTLQIGQNLKIPSMDGILYTAKQGDTPLSIADKYRISLEKIAIVNAIQDNAIEAGAVLFLPDAKLDWVTLQEINGDLFRHPLKSSYYISSLYGWRNNPFSGARTFHNGIDMATARGTAVYAALDGRVSATGYDVTYGNYVIITHHSGYQTLYGHLNSILTTKGAYVTTSTRIGTVGNTGQSTGPHLHFTVYKNRATMNPAVLWN